MRPLGDEEIPDGPDEETGRPWLLRTRLVVMVLLPGTLLALLARIDHETGWYIALLPRVLLTVGVAIYLWHLAEHSLLGRRMPPRVLWIFDRPSRHQGLGLHLLLVAGGWSAAGLLASWTGGFVSVAALALGFVFATPWACLSLVQYGGKRRPGFGEAFGVLDGLGGWGILGGLVYGAALTSLYAGLALGFTSFVAWWVLIAWTLLAARTAGGLFEARAAFVDVQTEEDEALKIDEAAFQQRLNRLKQRLHNCQETGDVPEGVRHLESFLAQDDYVLDQRLLYELSEWTWPRLALEHARNVVARLLAAGKERAAWGLVMESDPDGTFLPASFDDLERLARLAASPGERRAVIAMVKRAEGAAKKDDARLGRIWLAAAEVAAAEGQTSPARVWLGRVETRFPDELRSEEGRARQQALRAVIGS